MADFRVIPSIEQIRQRGGVRALEERFGSNATLDALRQAAARLRETIATGAGPDSSDGAALAIEEAAGISLAASFRGSLRPVINATGVVIHTNLGRAPIAPAALDRVAAIARGYSNLEYDLETGTRGARHVHAEALLASITGAEAAIVVNNNAAATLLILAGLAAGRDVLISRGELVEIGGGFRVPDVLRQSGALLREVGTTNRTRVNDYVAAVSTNTGLILRVHPSNFRIEGFTERPALADLVATAHAMSIPIVEDLGSGCLVDLPRSESGGDPNDEPSVQASIAAGVDLVCFSGDKLLGGPQAGIIAGKRELVDRLKQHPLMRALRVDKITLAILEATLAEYAADRARESVPVQRMLHVTAEQVETRAVAAAERLAAGGWKVSLVSGHSAVGGGSAPGLRLPTVLLAIGRDDMSAAALERWLRTLDPPVVARIEENLVVLDLRTVLVDQDELLLSVLL